MKDSIKKLEQAKELLDSVYGTLSDDVKCLIAEVKADIEALNMRSVGRSLPTDEEIISEIELHEQIDTKTEHSGNVKLWIDMYKLGFKKAQTIDVER